MSWDIFVQDIPDSARDIDDVPDDFQPCMLGQRSEIIRRIQQVVPAANFSDPSFGSFDGPDFSVEFNLGGDDEVEGFALHIRGADAAAAFVADLLTRCGWRAFDPSSPTGIFDPATAVDSLRTWRAYRDRALHSDHDV